MKNTSKLILSLMMASTILTACNKPQQNAEEAKPAANQTEEANKTEDTKNTVETKDSNDTKDNQVKDEQNTTDNSDIKSLKSLSDVKVSVNDALKTFKEKYPNAEIFKIAFDEKDYKWTHIVKANNDGKEIEVYIDANSGEIVKDDIDEDHISDSQTFNLEDAKLTPEEAVKKAFEKINDENAILDGYELDYEDGKLQYEVELRLNDEDYNVKIDASSGDILEFDK